MTLRRKMIMARSQAGRKCVLTFPIQALLPSLMMLLACPKAAAQVRVLTSTYNLSVFGNPDSSTKKGNGTYFSDAVYAHNSIVFTSISAAESIDYRDETFSGYGNVRVTGDVGLPSLGVAGNTAAYILFNVTNAFRYQWVSTVDLHGNVKGYTRFNGVTNSGGTVRLTGTIKAGDLNEIQVLMNQGTNAASGQGDWAYSLSLTPTLVPSRFTKDQKENLSAQETALRTLGNQMLEFAQKSTKGGLQLELVSAANAILVLADALQKDAQDPLDTNYTVLSEAVPLALTPLTASTNITPHEAESYNAWLTNLAQAAGYGAALSSSLDRAQGAAYAGDAHWEAAQVNAAVQFEAQLALLLDQEPAIRSNIVAQFQADGFSSVTASADDVLSLQLQIGSNGLPSVISVELTALGVDAQTITNWQNRLLASDPDMLAGSFPQSLMNTNWDAATHKTAASLRDASLTLIRAKLNPGGQMSFDVPTEPGYSYTIQFAQSVVDPVSWMTLFSTNAATTLLSFTNTPPAGARTGFYRVSHD